MVFHDTYAGPADNFNIDVSVDVVVDVYITVDVEVDDNMGDGDAIGVHHDVNVSDGDTNSEDDILCEE